MGIVRPVMDVYPYAWLLFIPFILIATFTMLNLFIGIIVDTMQTLHDDQHAAERERIEDTVHRDTRHMGLEVRALREEIEGLRRDCVGTWRSVASRADHVNRLGSDRGWIVAGAASAWLRVGTGWSRLIRQGQPRARTCVWYYDTNCRFWDACCCNSSTNKPAAFAVSIRRGSEVVSGCFSRWSRGQVWITREEVERCSRSMQPGPRLCAREPAHG